MYPPSTPTPTQASAVSFSLQQFVKKNALVVSMVIGVLLFSMAVLLLIANRLNSTPRTITVLGRGVITVNAGGAEVLVQLVQNADDSVIAGNLLNQKYQSLVDQLTGVPDVVVSAGADQVSAGQTSVVSGQTNFQATKAIRIKVADVRNLATVITAIRSAQGTIAKTSYLPEDPVASRQQALDAAYADAKSKAQVIAKMSGGRVGEVLSIADSTQEESGEVVADAQSTVPQIQVVSAVTINYRLR